MYGLISDLHLHNWTAFSKPSKSGVNSRLTVILDEARRAAQSVKDKGGSTMIIAGDIFHVRGSIAPSVLNPTLDVFREIIEDIGIKVVAIPGNHDLEGYESRRVSNAVAALESVGVEVCHRTTQYGMDSDRVITLIPWIKSIDELKLQIEAVGSELAKHHRPENLDLIIHAPLNGVIKGIPDHGLDPEWLGMQGFGNVFAGHYHNHKDFGNGVYSIGATTHQTWGDVNTRAGFLLVDGGNVKYQASHAPGFVDIESAEKEEEIPLIADGNYVRARLEFENEAEIISMREFLLNDCGAAGVVIHPIKKGVTVSRTGSTVAAGADIRTSISDYIKHRKFDRAKELQAVCEEILTESADEI